VIPLVGRHESERTVLLEGLKLHMWHLFNRYAHERLR
jgi:hypothetical protein